MRTSGLESLVAPELDDATTNKRAVCGPNSNTTLDKHVPVLEHELHNPRRLASPSAARQAIVEALASDIAFAACFMKSRKHMATGLVIFLNSKASGLLASQACSDHAGKHHCLHDRRLLDAFRTGKLRFIVRSSFPARHVRGQEVYNARGKVNARRATKRYKNKERKAPESDQILYHVVVRAVFLLLPAHPEHSLRRVVLS